MEEIDEDKILEGLSAEELQQLQNEMDDIAPYKTIPVGMRQNNASVEATTEGFLFFAVTYHCCFSFSTCFSTGCTRGCNICSLHTKCVYAV